MKEIAASIQSIATSQTMARILDRGENISGIVEKVLSHWQYDLFSRSPGPALLENGVLTPTDLDLACFLSALADRKAVVSLPVYRGRRPKTVRAGERVVSDKNRHGKIMGLVANKEVFSFSLRILDANVIVSGNEDEEDKVGEFRNFMVVDINGEWHDGWHTIEFMPNRKENDFLTNNRLWTGNQVVFSNFVHPNRWTSFYGAYYLLTKVLMQRLEEEGTFLRAQCKRLQAEGISFPATGAGARKPSRPTEETGPSATETVTAFECEVDAPWVGEFQPLPRTQDALVAAAERAKVISYTMNPQLRFPIRATELAFYLADAKERGFPSWIKGAQWESGYVPSGMRTKFERLVLHQNFPGQKAFALRYRTYSKSEKVAAG